MLAQLLISLPLAAISIFGMSIFLNRSIKETTRMDIQMSLDLAHAQALHEIQGFQKIALNTNLGAELDRTDLQNCIAGKGTNCTQFSNNPFIISSLGSSTTFSQDKSRNGSGVCSIVTPQSCPFSQEALASWQCQADRCSALEINLTTRVKASSSNEIATTRHQVRQTKILLPARAKVARANIDFSCIGTSLVRGINYEYGNAVCGVIPDAVNTLSNFPARAVSTATPEQMTIIPLRSVCSTGFSSGGLLHQGVCNETTNTYAPVVRTDTTAPYFPGTPGYPGGAVIPTPPAPAPCPAGYTRNAWGICTPDYNPDPGGSDPYNNNGAEGGNGQSGADGPGGTGGATNGSEGSNSTGAGSADGSS